jgi:predicted  nucleic acid-binding Zn-ribbon protein
MTWVCYYYRKNKMNISFNLYQLQKIDSQIAQRNQRLSAIEKEMEGSPELRKARLEVIEALKRLNDSIKEFNEVNDKVETKKIKIDQSESALYKGAEKNPKVLQDLQKEITFLKNNLTDLNDELLEKMISREKFEIDFKNAKEIQQIEETKFNSIKAILTSEKENIEISINRLAVERKANIEQISIVYLKEYESLFENKKGIAVATLQDNSCSVCGTTFTPSQCQASHSQAEIFHCPTCHRIVYGG